MLSLPEYMEQRFGHGDVSDELFSICYKLMFIAGPLAVLGFAGTIFSDRYILSALFTLVTGLCAAFGFWMFATQQVTILNDPPQRGTVCIWGKRLKTSVPEGDKMGLKPWPFKITYLPTDMTQATFTIPFKELNHKGAGGTNFGATTDAEVVLTLVPHEDRLPSFQNIGGWPGVLENAKGLLGRALRRFSPYYGWQDFTKMKSQLEVELLVGITETGFDFRMLPRIDGELPESSVNITAEEYRRLPIVPDPIAHLFGTAEHPLTDEERRKRLPEIAIFQRLASENGVAAIPNLGVKVRGLSVSDIKGDPAVVKAAARIDAEALEHDSDKRDAETGDEIAAGILQKVDARPGERMTYERAYLLQLANRGRARETTVNVNSSGNQLVDAGALIGLGATNQQGG